MDYYQYLEEPIRAFERRVVKGYESNWLTAEAEAAVSEEARIRASEADGPNSPDYDNLVERFEQYLTEELCDEAAALSQ